MCNRPNHGCTVSEHAMTEIMWDYYFFKSGEFVCLHRSLSHTVTITRVQQSVSDINPESELESGDFYGLESESYNKWGLNPHPCCRLRVHARAVVHPSSSSSSYSSRNQRRHLTTPLPPNVVIARRATDNFETALSPTPICITVSM